MVEIQQSAGCFGQFLSRKPSHHNHYQVSRDERDSADDKNCKTVSN